MFIADTPENLEMFGLLVQGASVRGSGSSDLVVWKRGGRLIVIKGRPGIDSVETALEEAASCATVMLRDAGLNSWHDLFQGWRARKAIRCVQREPVSETPNGVWFAPSLHSSLLDRMPYSYTEELLEGHSAGKVALSLEAGSIASYCFPGWVTPRHFDLNVVTLPQFRERGHARICCSLLLSNFAASGRQAQWLVEDANRASVALSRRLGFQPLESVLLLRPQCGINES